MPKKKLIVPIKDLAELHERAEFPLDAVILKFKDYGWLAKFFGECFEYLYARGEIKFQEIEQPHRKLPRGLDNYLSTKLGYTDVSLSAHLRLKAGVSLLIMAFLIKACNRTFEEVQKQIAYMYLRYMQAHERAIVENRGMKTIYILHKSKSALAPHTVAALLKSEFGDAVSVGYSGRYLSQLCQYGYFSRHGQKGAPFYTLRGEEHKFRG